MEAFTEHINAVDNNIKFTLDDVIAKKYELKWCFAVK